MNLLNFSPTIFLFDKIIEESTFGMSTHQSLVNRLGNTVILVNTTFVKLNFECGSAWVVTDRTEV